LFLIRFEAHMLSLQGTNEIVEGIPSAAAQRGRRIRSQAQKVAVAVAALLLRGVNSQEAHISETVHPDGISVVNPGYASLQLPGMCRDAPYTPEQ
jgi:hypothetical protein